MKEAAERVLKWIEGHPVLRLGIILFVVGQTSWIFVEDRFVKPREEAIRGGYYYDPQVQIQFDGTRCLAENKGSRPIIQVQLVGAVFETNVAHAHCEGVSYRESHPAIYAKELEYGAVLATDDLYRFGFRYYDEPYPIPTVATLSPNNDIPNQGKRRYDEEWLVEKEQCRNKGNCIVFKECRATFRRASDHRMYKTSAYVVLDWTRKEMKPEDLSLFYSQRLNKSGREWSDRRIQKGYECVEKKERWSALLLHHIDRISMTSDPLPE